MIKGTQVKCIMKMLYDAGLKPIFHKKAMSGSFYIKFGANIGGSLRIGNHPQRSRYAYRWNLREDIGNQYSKIKLDHFCHYYPFSDFERMVGDMIKEKNEREEIMKNGAESVVQILLNRGNNGKRRIAKN